MGLQACINSPLAANPFSQAPSQEAPGRGHWPGERTRTLPGQHGLCGASAEAARFPSPYTSREPWQQGGHMVQGCGYEWGFKPDCGARI